MAYTDYPNEKVILVETEELQPPVTYVVKPKRPSALARVARVALAFITAVFALNLISAAFDQFSGPGCLHGKDDHHHQHPVPPIEHWKPYEGTTHFEIDPESVSGLSCLGPQSFGKVIFETSKISKQVVIDLEIKTNKKDKHGEVGIEEKDGHITIESPKTGKLETHVSAKVQIPSNVIGKFGLSQFKLELSRFMVDYSGLPESLEIDDFNIKIAKGFVKPGSVHTNQTTIDIAKGAIKGSLTQAREVTSVNVASGNMTLDVSKASRGESSTSKFSVGDGRIEGKYQVYHNTAFKAASGDIDVKVDFQSGPNDEPAELNSKMGSGTVKINVESIAAERIFKSYHDSVAGDQSVTYPDNFQGTIDARDLVGSINMEGKDLTVEKVLGGMQGKKGDSERNYVSVKAAKGDITVTVE